MTTERRYYFQIKSANVCECIMAHSFSEAKHEAFQYYAPWWNEIEWLNPETVTDVVR